LSADVKVAAVIMSLPLFLSIDSIVIVVVAVYTTGINKNLGVIGRKELD
jgi:hypothetical protein